MAANSAVCKKVKRDSLSPGWPRKIANVRMGSNALSACTHAASAKIPSVAYPTFPITVTSRQQHCLPGSSTTVASEFGEWGINMKKFAFGMLAVVAMTGSAVAADMAPRYTKAPVAAPVAVYDWTSFYIGADVGGDWIRGDAFTSFVQPGGGGVGFSAFNQSRRLTSSGFIGGVYAGYNWQAANWVLGLEADISGLANSNSTAT